MFSKTDMPSKSEKCWNTMPMPSARAACGSATRTSVPSQKIDPSSGCSTP
jgi:hypothetical protein